MTDMEAEYNNLAKVPEHPAIIAGSRVEELLRGLDRDQAPPGP